jgi:hypothetical protein
MTDPDTDPIGAAFVDAFNLDLATLSSTARVALATDGPGNDRLELQDDEGLVLALIPTDASPEMAAIAFRLHGQGLNRGVRAGEEAAWAKLRYLIGATAVA